MTTSIVLRGIMSESKSITFMDGTRVWCRGSRLHREDGPAFEGADGSQAYYLDGKHLAPQEHASAVSLLAITPQTVVEKSRHWLRKES